MAKNSEISAYKNFLIGWLVQDTLVKLRNDSLIKTDEFIEINIFIDNDIEFKKKKGEMDLYYKLLEWITKKLKGELYRTPHWYEPFKNFDLNIVKIDSKKDELIRATDFIINSCNRFHKLDNVKSKKYFKKFYLFVEHFKDD